MITLPSSLVRKRVYSELKKGKILRTELIFRTGPRYKRLILLNKDFLEDNIFYIFTTSNVDWYKNHGTSEPVKGNFILIPKGHTKFNPNKDMIVDCRKIRKMKKEKLLENFKENKLNFLGEIPKEIMNQIDHIISISRLIPLREKRHII